MRCKHAFRFEQNESSPVLLKGCYADKANDIKNQQ